MTVIAAEGLVTTYISEDKKIGTKKINFDGVNENSILNEYNLNHFASHQLYIQFQRIRDRDACSPLQLSFGRRL